MSLHLINTIGDWVGKIVSFVMVVIIGYMMASVILRYFFKSPTDYLTIVPNIFYLYVSFGAAYAYNQKIFMNVDVLYRLFSPRKRAAIDLITSLFFFLFVISLFWVSGQYTLKALPKTKFDWEMLINPARWPATVLFPVGLILLLLSGIARFARNLVTLLTGEEAVIKENVKTTAGGEKE